MKQFSALFISFLFPLFSFAQVVPSGQTMFPADQDSCEATSVQLCAYVGDTDGDSLLVNFYFRPSNAAPPDFTIVGLPDTQYYTSQLNGGSNEYFKAQTNWIVSHKDSLNVAHVCHLGDCVQNGDYNNIDTEWKRADTAMSFIEDPLTTNLPEGISYTMAVGNHDQWPTGDPNGTTIFYNQYFGASRFGSRAYWGGNYLQNADNNFQLFSASGYDFLVISLEYDGNNANPGVLFWADSLLQAYPNRKGIIVSHYLLNINGTFGAQGAAVYAALRPNPNLFLMLCGHVSGEAHRTDVYNGDTTHTILSDFQSRPSGGAGWMRFMTLSPEFNTLTVKTYSPVIGQYENDTNSLFVLPVDLYPQTNYTSLGSAWVDSAGMACITVNGLLPNTAYDWYATIDDSTTIVKTNYSRFATYGSVVSISSAIDTICHYAAPITLTGLPSGGTFTGIAVSGNQFDPAFANTGTNSVSYSYTNANGCVNSDSLSMYVELCAGVNEMVLSQAPAVYYQSGQISVSGLPFAATISVYDMTGRELMQTKLVSGMNSIPFSPAVSGIYLFRIANEDQMLMNGKIFAAE